MELKVKDVAELLKVSEKTIYRMVQSETIPSIKVGGQWRFRREEILAWVEDAKDVASAMDFGTSSSINNDEKIQLSELLKRGSIYYRIDGSSKESVIKESMFLIRRGANKNIVGSLVNSAMKRESLCSTAIGHGIALPHPRYLQGYTSEVSFISLCFLEKPIPFGALDGEDVSILFFISPRNEVRYLRLQAKLLAYLRRKSVLTTLKKVPLREKVYELFSSEEPLANDN